VAEIVLTSRDDWQLYCQQRIEGSHQILALTPNAQSEALNHMFPLIDTMKRYNDCAEARTVAKVMSARTLALETVGALSDLEREVLVDQINRVAYGAWRLWLTLGSDGPWIVVEDGKFKLQINREKAYLSILNHFLTPKMRGEMDSALIKPPPLKWLYKVLRQLALCKNSNVQMKIAMGTAKKNFGLHEILDRQSCNIRNLHISNPTRGWREYLKLIREIFRNTKPNGSVQVSLVGIKDSNLRSLADDIVVAMVDPVIKPALAIYRNLLAYKLAWLPALQADANSIIDRFRPDIYTAAEISSLSNYVVAEACGIHNVPRFVMSRNSHSMSDSVLANDSCIGYFKARYPKSFFDIAFVTSPAAATVAEAALPAHLKKKIRPIIARPVRPISSSKPKDIKTILLADTYAAWWFPHSYVFLTGDAFLSAAQILAKEIAKIKNTHLVIRAKNKPECDLRALEKLVNPHPNCEIKIRDESFESDLDKADLLVSFHSTTIEQAIFYRKPVLLWGNTLRYAFLPARDKRPTNNDRGVLYRVSKGDDLSEMIKAILESHHCSPLSDRELEPYCWPTDTPGINDIAREFLEDFSKPKSVDNRGK